MTVLGHPVSQVWLTHSRRSRELHQDATLIVGPSLQSCRIPKVVVLTLPLLSTHHCPIRLWWSHCGYCLSSCSFLLFIRLSKTQRKPSSSTQNMVKIWRTRREFSNSGPFPNLASVPREFGVYLATTRRIKSVSKLGEDLASNSARIWRVALLPRLGENSAKIRRQFGDPCFSRKTNTFNTQLDFIN